MVYLLRHGLDDETFIGGWSDGKLLKEGITQSHIIGKYINDNINSITRIYSSDISRAIQTASIVNQYLNLPLIVTSDLRELDKGMLTGMNAREAKEKYKELFLNQTIDTRYPNGESMRDLYNRVEEYLKNIHEFDNSLIITHRGVINMIYFILNNIELDMNKERFGVTHASIHQLDISKKLIKKIK